MTNQTEIQEWVSVTGTRYLVSVNSGDDVIVVATATPRSPMEWSGLSLSASAWLRLIQRIVDPSKMVGRVVGTPGEIGMEISTLVRNRLGTELVSLVIWESGPRSGGWMYIFTETGGIELAISEWAGLSAFLLRLIRSHLTPGVLAANIHQP